MRDSLQELARLYGVQTVYEDVDHRSRHARPEAVLAVLKALGTPVETLMDCAAAVRWRRLSLWQTLVPPVTVAWEAAEGPPAVELRVPASAGRAGADSFRCRLEIENSGPLEWAGRIGDLPTRRERVVEGVRYAARRLALPGGAGLPVGYHRLTVELSGRSAGGLVLVAPMRAYEGDGQPERTWGVFLPLYALHRRLSWGAGDLGDLEALIRWTAARGGGAVQVLPLLASLWELGDGASPYEPATRLFWNEFYLDVTRIAHVRDCPEAAALVEQARDAGQMESLRKRPLVDYAAQMALKRRIVTVLAEGYFARPYRTGLEEYCRRQPLAETLARFRAVGERQGAHWPQWPDRLRLSRKSEPGDYDVRAFHYYLYSQWQTDEQLQSAGAVGRQAGARLSLDLPLGVRRDGFDSWLEPDLFAPGMGVGAPPDTFFSAGQNWGFSPPHPGRQREQGYRYFAAGLRRHLECAGALRLDHVMGLHRLFWVPDGMEARDGVYVRYPAEEQYAVLAIESRRHAAVIVGENLGTVPEAVNQSMRRHGVCSMYVVPFEVSSADKKRSLPPLYWHLGVEAKPSSLVRPAPPDCVASLNTHDMPTFAAFWAGQDIEDRLGLGLLDAAAASQQHDERRATRLSLLAHLRDHGFPLDQGSPADAVLEACLVMLGDGPARRVLVNLEDLWGETRPQNVPGGVEDAGHPNWRGRAKYSLEEFAGLPEVVHLLETLDRSRRRPPRRTRREPALAAAGRGGRSSL